MSTLRTLVFGTVAVCVVGAAQAVAPIVHPAYKVMQANVATSERPLTRFWGFKGAKFQDRQVSPGFFDIVAGTSWSNYVTAASKGVAYSVKNVVMIRQTPATVQCAEVFPHENTTQESTPNIRCHWPTMYEVPGTTWTLTILYGTVPPWDDDGPTGPNPASNVHQETWSWQVDATFDSMLALMELFHNLPCGKTSMPLISDEALYPVLVQSLLSAKVSQLMGNSSAAASKLADFELLVMDSCISVAPGFPYPTGEGTGIIQTEENPACCKLLVDVEYLFSRYNLSVP